MKKKVTVFMPVYNAEKYLSDAIESILNQTYEHFEFLIIDDGSTDASIKIIESYKDKRIRLVKNEKNRGLPYTRNLGLKLAKGDYIALMDSDDISYEQRLEKQVKYLNENPEIDVLSTGIDYLYGKKIMTMKSYERNDEVLRIMLMFYNVINNPTVMLRRDFIIKNNLKYREEFIVAQDYSFWIDCLEVGKIHCMKKNLLAYRTGHENISKISMTQKREQRKSLIYNIKKRALINNKFVLDNKMIEKFNEFFYENIDDLKIEDFQAINSILLHMNNTNQNHLNPKLLAHISKYSFTNVVICSNLNVVDKLKLIKTRYREETFNSWVFAYIRIIKSILI